MKDFLIIGNLNAVKYKEVFPLIKVGEVRLGVCNRIRAFVTHEGTLQPFGNTYWFTTLTHDRINPPLTLTATYTPEAYPRYDNYDAINVDKTKDIPCDYYGVMGVPISFLDKWCAEQFEMVGITDSAHAGFAGLIRLKTAHGPWPYVNGVRRFERVFIRRRQ